MSGTSVSFDSSTTTGDPASYDWDFGDGTAHSSAANPSHTFQYPGPHHVTLTVTATDSSESVVVQDVVVQNQAPTAAFSTGSTPRLSAPVAFSDGSSDPDGQAPLTYQWAFGDGATSTSREPAHKYDTPGTQTVTLTVSDDRGATASVSHDVHVVDDSVHANITFAPAGPATGEAVSFDGHASSVQGIDSYKWTFDDGTTSTAMAPVHAFATAGDHTVDLTVTSTWGVTSTTSATVPVKAPTTSPGGGSGDPGAGAGSGDPGSGNPGPGTPGPGTPGSGTPGPGGPNPGGGQPGGSGSGEPGSGTSQPGGGSSTDKPKPGKKKNKKKCVKRKHGKGAGKKGKCVKKHPHKGGKKPHRAHVR
jgi:PKD repeat protein